jgi:hypothetical protein
MFRLCSVPLVTALAVLAYSTTRATMACLASTEDAEIVEAGPQELEGPGEVQDAAQPGLPNTAVAEAKTAAQTPQSGPGAASTDPAAPQQASSAAHVAGASSTDSAVVRAEDLQWWLNLGASNRSVPGVVVKTLLRRARETPMTLPPAAPPGPVHAVNPAENSPVEQATPQPAPAGDKAHDRAALDARIARWVQQGSEHCKLAGRQLAGALQGVWTESTRRAVAFAAAARVEFAQIRLRGGTGSGPAATGLAGTGQTRANPTAPVTLLNPVKTGGTVHYLLNGEVRSLRPGDKQELPSGRSWRVRFHRGADFGEAEYTPANGLYEFQVTEHGWDLSRTSGTAAANADDRTN